jgi:hypothetical protein
MMGTSEMILGWSFWVFVLFSVGAPAFWIQGIAIAIAMVAQIPPMISAEGGRALIGIESLESSFRPKKLAILKTQTMLTALVISVPSSSAFLGRLVQSVEAG